MKARIQITRSHIAFILLSVLTVFWISFIFGNSTLNREESTAQSDVVVEYISPIVDPHDQMSDGQITRMVRKGAHALEFFVLGLCVAATAITAGLRKWKYAPAVAGVCLAVAAADEWIQSFSDRAPQFSDAMIDLAGASVGVALVYLIASRRKRERT